MLRRLALALPLAFALALPAAARTFTEMFPAEVPQLDADSKALADQIDFKLGSIDLPEAGVRFDLSDQYYFLDKAGTKTVLSGIWGNPENIDALGMIFPATTSPFDAGWGLVIFYDPIGHVSDEDAASIDYGELLKSLQKEVEERNAARKEKGYGSVRLIGWAEPPHYSIMTRQLFWAKELSFEGNPAHTLNFDLRVLGRKGVLAMSFVAGIDELAAVKAAAPEILAMTHFTEGNRYEDFIPSADSVAAVGIAGLIGAKVAAKTGLLVLLIPFLKKGVILILLPLIWLKNRIRGRRNDT